MSLIYLRSYLHHVIFTMISLVISHAYSVIPEKFDDERSAVMVKTVPEKKADPLSTGFPYNGYGDNKRLFKQGTYKQLTLMSALQSNDKYDMRKDEGKSEKILKDTYLPDKKKPNLKKVMNEKYCEHPNKKKKARDASPLAKEPDKDVKVDASNPRCQKTQVVSKHSEVGVLLDEVSVGDEKTQCREALQLFHRMYLNEAKRGGGQQSSRLSDEYLKTFVASSL